MTENCELRRFRSEHRWHHRVLAALVFTVPAVTAQVTHHVDPNGGPSAFPTLAAAVNAAANGDTIRVSPGFDHDFDVTTAKGLTIVGDGAPATYHGMLSIDGLPAGQRFVLRDVVAAPSSSIATGTIRLYQCAGSVVLDRVSVVGSVLASGTLRTGIGIGSCSQVTLNEVACIGYPGLFAHASTVAASSSTFEGASMRFAPAGMTPQPGIEASSTNLLLTDCSLAGGTLLLGFPTPYPFHARGLELSGGLARLAGGSIASASFEAVELAAGTQLSLDSAVQLLPNAIGGGIATPLETGRVDVDLAPVGAPGTVRFDGPAGAVGLLAWGLADAPFASPFGAVWLHPQAFQVLAVGSLPLQVPVMLVGPIDAGLTVAAQGLLLNQGTHEISNPVVTTVP